jgi:hypothetical protein
MWVVSTALGHPTPLPVADKAHVPEAPDEESL